MADKELKQNSYKRRRQPPSVPFLWEIMPGIPKKNWKPEAPASSSVSAPPVKLIASVPFIWEEKPGTPLPSFSHRSRESASEPSSARLLPPPPWFENFYEYFEKDDDGHHSGGDGGDDKSMSKQETESLGSEADDSYSSVPSLLANCLVSSSAISTAVPVPAQETSVVEENSDRLEMPLSPASETGSSTSSYATGNSSLVGSSFLECLFPLFPPNSGFLEKVGHPEPENSVTLTPPAQMWNKNFDPDNNGSVIVRRQPTLGELIMMSRRRSYRRKAVQMRKQNLSMELMKRGAVGCCIFGTGSKLLEGLHNKRKQLPHLKLAW
ncbi:hypothetical protein UlMin_026619 [Ulmus minor]